jgi:hypothetical protein
MRHGMNDIFHSLGHASVHHHCLLEARQLRPVGIRAREATHPTQVTHSMQRQQLVSEIDAALQNASDAQKRPAPVAAESIHND